MFTGEDVNPFIYNAPVRGEDFFNRETVIEQLLKETVLSKSQGNLWITGERQVGKTSLLRYIQLKYEDFDQKIKLYGSKQLYDVAFIYTNVQDCDSRDKFYQNLRIGLKNFFDFKLKISGKPFDDFIQALLYSYQLNYYIIFLIDEFDAFIQNFMNSDSGEAVTFLGEMNKLSSSITFIKNDPKVFGCIFSANASYAELLKEIGLKKDIGSGLVTEGMELDWFTEKQATRLAISYLKGNPVQFTSDDLRFCFKMTKGYPFFLQRLFYELYEEKTKYPSDKNYLKKIKKKYGLIFQKTIKSWGGKMLPGRTAGKLIKLAEYIGDKAVLLGIEVLKKEIGL